MRTALVTSPPPSAANLAARLKASGKRGQRRDSARLPFHLLSVSALKVSGSQTGQLEENAGSCLPAPLESALGPPKGEDNETLELKRCC